MKNLNEWIPGVIIGIIYLIIYIAVSEKNGFAGKESSDEASIYALVILSIYVLFYRQINKIGEWILKKINKKNKKDK